jgi:hypothetical protein
MTQNVLCIGVPLLADGVTSDNFLSTRNFAEYSVIIWDPSTLAREATLRYPAGSDKVSEAFTTSLNERTREIDDFLKNGGDLIIVLRRLRTLTQQGSRFVKRINLNDSGPLSLVSSVARNGKSVEWIGPSELKDRMNELAKSLTYSAICNTVSEYLLPLWRVPNTNQILGGVITRKGGSIIFIPYPGYWDDPGELISSVQRNQKFLREIARLPDDLRKLRNKREKLPEWANSIHLPDERAARDRISDLASHMEKLRAEIKDNESVIVEAENWKRLFTAHDEELVDAVMDALASIGIKTVRGPKGRADLVAVYDGRLAALEIKGKTGPAADKDARQCVTWVSDVEAAQISDEEQRRLDTVTREYLTCLSELGIEPCAPDDPDPHPVEAKGIVIINTFREKSLVERIDPDFPNSMHRTIINQKICALRSLQLLGMCIEAQRDPTIASALARMLFDTVGVLGEYTGWQEYLLTSMA